MKTYLPYWCKKLGIALVFIALILSFIANINSFVTGFLDGYYDHQYNYDVNGIVDIISVDMGKTLTWVSLLFSFSGFLSYMFSREKIEDEFIERLRFLSLAKSLLVTWIYASLLYFFSNTIKLEGFYILQFQLIIYVVIYNYYKKIKFK